MKGRQLNAFATAKVLQEHEDRITALEGGNSSNEEEEENGATEPLVSTVDLSFTVNDGTNPISGATVTIGSKSHTTGSAGGCSITGVEQGTVSVEVSAEGYETKTESITVDKSNTSFTITLVASVNDTPKSS